MKSIRYLQIMLFAGSILFLTSCDKRTQDQSADSKEKAEEKNEAKFVDSKIEDDTEFAVAIADGGMLEVQLAELALKNASSPDVKKFAEVMLTDHSKTNTELKDLAAKKNISIPGTLSDKCQMKYNDLAEKKGKSFDEAYSKAMVDAHKETIDKFKNEAENGNDPDLKKWAAEKIPTLEHHLSMAQDTETSVKKNS